MAALNKFQSFVEALAEGKHDFSSDQLVVALCNASNAPVNTNTVLADLTEIAYTNLSTRNITLGASAQTGGVYKLTLTDLTLTASGAVAAFQYVVIYNDDAASDELLWWYDYGSEITLGNGDTFTIDFDASNGVITIT